MSDKVSKASVDYGPGHPKGDHCAVCRHFEKPHGCEVVEGPVSPMGWCKRFTQMRRSQKLYR